MQRPNERDIRRTRYEKGSHEAERYEYTACSLFRTFENIFLFLLSLVLMETVAKSEFFSEFMTIIRETVFAGSYEEANVFALLMRQFWAIQWNYPVQTSSDGMVTRFFSIVKTTVRGNTEVDETKYTLANTFGVIVNGGVRVPSDALEVVNELFRHALRVSL